MKLKNINGHKNIESFIADKLDKFSKEEKTFKNLYCYMFSEKENIMTEYYENNKFYKKSYHDVDKDIKILAANLNLHFKYDKQSYIGIFMTNSLKWLEVFWAILMLGYCPLLLNLNFSTDILEKIISNHNVKCIISENQKFNVDTIFINELSLNTDVNYIDDKEWGNEVIFMSSGTTENIKLCTYTAEKFYYQILNSLDIVKRCPQIAKHYNGELKHLVILPFYHIFGFIAVYLWFGFFSRTFVFTEDLNPKTIQNIIKIHKITHFFGVPLIWEQIYKKVIETIKNKSERKYRLIRKIINFSNKSNLNKSLSKRATKIIRDNLFGDSIQFLISGGSFISSEVLEFFTGIGYFIVNGYGTTETGITSVETSNKAKIRNIGSIGNPFKFVQYSFDENGILLIKAKSSASKITLPNRNIIIDENMWYKTMDIGLLKNNFYHITGRFDDLIVHKNGENINPILIENELIIDHVDQKCVFELDGEIILLVSSTKCFSQLLVNKIFKNITNELLRTNNLNKIKKIFITPDKLLDSYEIKINRKKIKRRFKNNEYTLIQNNKNNKNLDSLNNKLILDLIEIFKEVFSLDEVSIDSDFFIDLGGTSLDYFVLCDLIETKFGVNIRLKENNNLTSIKAISKYIENHQ